MDKHKKFVRFGVLGVVKQKGFVKENKYSDDCNFHEPPAYKGFYAMPYLYQESFLIGSLAVTQPQFFKKLPTIDWETATEEEIQKYHNLRDLNHKKIQSLAKYFFIKNDDEIWHHLVEKTPNSEIIDRHGSWIKTSYKAWKTAILKEPKRNKDGFKYSKDHFEVFFDYKVC